MQIEKLSYQELLNLKNNETDLRVRFTATDLCDHYAIVHTRFDSEAPKKYFFMFYLADELEAPCEVIECKSMTDAMLHLSYRFILDNCDCETDDNSQEALRKLTTYE